MRKSVLLFSLLLFCLPAMAQKELAPKKLVQFSGVVVNADSLSPVPFTSIIIKGTNHGTISDFYGYFSIVASEGDEVQFSATGYKQSKYRVPDSLRENRYSLIHVLQRDTVLLKETVIYPWPTREQFKQAFLNTPIPDDDLARAQKNLARAEMKERADNLAMDGNMNQKYYIQQYQSKLYYAGQLPPNNLFNPIAWAQFVKAWKRGDFTKGTDKKLQEDEDYAR